MKRGASYKWIPLWVDKWLWGSTRYELSHEERAIFLDFLALASKDDGYIRANETTPYPIEQLAGMLNSAPDLLRNTISKCIQFGKLSEKEGIYFVNNWNEYRLKGGYKRELSKRLKTISVCKKTVSAEGEASPFMSMSMSSSKNNTKKENKGGGVVAPRIILNDFCRFEEITEEFKRRMAEVYPAVDFNLTIKAIEAYALANPTWRKSNWARAINNWFKREQDRSPGRNRPAGFGSPSPSEFEALQEKALRKRG